jgi:hypothetical protein
MESKQSSCTVAILYTLHVPGLWDAVAARTHAADTAPSEAKERSVARELLDAAASADDSYHHPRARNNIKRFLICDDKGAPASAESEPPISVCAQISSDDLIVFSTFAFGLELNTRTILETLAGSRPAGRYRTNECEISLLAGNPGRGPLVSAFLEGVANLKTRYGVSVGTDTIVDYYPYIVLTDTTGKYSAARRGVSEDSELVALLTGELKHVDALKGGWAARHLGEDLAHTSTREFYVSAVGALYIFNEGPGTSGAHANQLDVVSRVLTRTMASLTFLEMFRSQVVLLRHLEDTVEDVFSRRLRESTPGDIVGLYLRTVRALARYDNRAVQTTAWRRVAWGNVRERFLSERFAALCFKLDRLEAVLDVFDRMRVQTFLVTLSVFLGLLAVLPVGTLANQLPTWARITFVVSSSWFVVLLVWRLHDSWWRRRLFVRRRSPALWIGNRQDRTAHEL